MIAVILWTIEVVVAVAGFLVANAGLRLLYVDESRHLRIRTFEGVVWLAIAAVFWSVLVAILVIVLIIAGLNIAHEWAMNKPKVGYPRQI